MTKSAKSVFIHQEAVDNILQDMRRDILLGKYHSQKYISENEIAEKYNVSRSTVRTAMMGLFSDGLINIKSNGRKEIQKVDRRYIQDLLTTRALLECEAARLILKKPQNDFSKLLEYVGKFHLELQEKDVEKRRIELARLNEDFHDELVKMSGNIFLLRCMRVIEPVLYTLSTITASIDPKMNRHDYFDSHKKIVDMLMNQDDGVIEYLRYHDSDAMIADTLMAISKEENIQVNQE